MKYTDKAKWPAALKHAEKIASNHYELTEEIKISIAPHRLRDYFKISLIIDGKPVTVPEGLLISPAEWEEYLEWAHNCQAAIYREGRIQLTSELRGYGFFQKESAGLQTAFKLYELLNLAEKPLSKSEILESEASLHLMAMKYGRELPGCLEIMRLPDLSIEGKMSDRASKALRALVSAGIVKRTGRTNLTVYSL